MQAPASWQPAQQQPSLTASQACRGAVDAHRLESVGQGGLAGAAGAVKVHTGQQREASVSGSDRVHMLYRIACTQRHERPSG